jgi:CheY-like chemotaxis protein
MRTNPRVLLVESDPVEREILGSWFESSGFEITACPGPTAPTYVCIGDRTGHCPLVDEADVVVLDCRLEGDELGEGTSPYDLLSLYATSEKPVVVLGGSEVSDLFAEDDVIFLEREPDGGVVEAVERLISSL